MAVWGNLDALLSIWMLLVMALSLLDAALYNRDVLEITTSPRRFEFNCLIVRCCLMVAFGGLFVRGMFVLLQI